jgi:hypothetical protein
MQEENENRERRVEIRSRNGCMHLLEFTATTIQALGQLAGERTRLTNLELDAIA